MQGNDFVSACAVFQKAVFSCGFDNAFIGFRAAVAEKYFFHAAFFTEEFCCLNAGLCVIQVGSVLQRLKLCAYCLYPAVVAKAQSVYADAAGEVDICFACVVLYGGAFAFCQEHGESAIGMDDVFIVILFCCLKIHVFPSFALW